MVRRLKRAYQRQIQSLRAEEVTRDGADFPCGYPAQTSLDFGGRNELGVAQPLFAHPVHLVIGAFETKIHLTNEIIPGSFQFGNIGCRVFKASQFAHDQRECLCQIAGVEPGRNDEVSGILEKAGAAVNGVSEAAVLADDLKETGTHILAKDRIQQAQSITPLVMSRARANTHCQLSLLGLLGKQADSRLGLILA